MADIEQAVVIRVRSDGTTEITKLAEELDKLKAKAGGAAGGAAPLGVAIGTVTKNASMASPQISALAGEAARLHATFTSAGSGATGLLGALGGLRGVAGVLLPITAGVIGLGAAFTLLKEGIKNAEKMNDLDRSMRAVSSSLESASAAMAFFERESRKTRDTGDELASVYARLLPMLKGAGFTESGAQQEVVQLSKAATTLALSLDTVVDSYRRLAAGQTGRNQLAMALGITPDELQKSSDALGLVDSKMAALIKSAGDAGQTTESAAKKIKDAWIDAFSNGIRGGSDLENTLQNITDKLTDPGIVQAIEQIGRAVIDVVNGFAEVARILKIVDDWQKRMAQRGNAAARPPDANPNAYVGPSVDFSDVVSGTERRVVPADNKAIEEAEKAAKQYREMVESMLGTSKSFQTEIRATVEAFNTLKAAMGEDAAMKAFGPKLVEIADKVELLGKAVLPTERAVLDLAVANRDGEKAAKDASAQLEALAKWNLENEKGFQRSAEKVSEFAAALAEIPTAISGPAMAEIKAVFASIDAMRANPIAAFGPLNSDALAEMVRRAEEAGDIVAKSIGDNALKAGKDIATAIQDALADSVARFQEAVHDLGQVMGDVFLDLSETGGENFGKIAAQMFVKNVQAGADVLAQMFGDAVVATFSGSLDKSSPKFLDESGKFDQSKFDAAEKKAADQSAQVMGAINGAIGLIGQTMTIFANAKKGQETSVLGTTISFAAAGASIGSLFPGLGTIIGAAVGAIAGAIVGLLANAKAKKEQPYAAYGIEDGQAYVREFEGQERQFENVTASMRNDMLQRMRKTMEETANGYTALLLKFPLRVVAGLNLGLESMDFSPTMDAIKKVTRGWFSMLIDPLGVNLLANAVQGLPLKPGTTRVVGTREGEIGNPNVDKAARKSFLDDFNNWVENTLPKEIAASFHDQTAEAFTAMGMTVTQFTTVWDKLQGMDPKEALQVLNDMADALIAFERVSMTMRGFGRKFIEGLRSGNELNEYGQARPVGVSAFTAQMASGYEDLIKFGIAIETLVGPEQVSAAKGLGDALQQIEGNLIAFLNSIIEINQQLSDEIASQRFEISYDQAETPQAQSDLLLQQYRNVVDQINNAAAMGLSPQDVQALTQEAMALIGRIYQIDTKGRAEWADAELAKLDRLQTEILKSLGNAAINLFEEVVNSMQPAIDFFKGLPEVAGEPLDNLANSANNAADALDRIGNRKQGEELEAQPYEPAPAFAPPPPVPLEIAPMSGVMPGEETPPIAPIAPGGEPIPGLPSGPDSGLTGKWDFAIPDGVSPEMRSYFIQKAMAAGGSRGPGELPANGQVPLVTESGGERMDFTRTTTERQTQAIERQSIALEEIVAAIKSGDAESSEIAKATFEVLRTGRDIRLDPGELTVNVNTGARMANQSNARRFIEGERYRRVVTRT